MWLVVGSVFVGLCLKSVLEMRWKGSDESGKRSRQGDSGLLLGCPAATFRLKRQVYKARNVFNTAQKNILGLQWDLKYEEYWGSVFIDLYDDIKIFPTEFTTNSKSISKNKVYKFFFPRWSITHTHLDKFLFLKFLSCQNLF